jgi:hypothetical protein
VQLALEFDSFAQLNDVNDFGAGGKYADIRYCFENNIFIVCLSNCETVSMDSPTTTTTTPICMTAPLTRRQTTTTIMMTLATEMPTV